MAHVKKRIEERLGKKNNHISMNCHRQCLTTQKCTINLKKGSFHTRAPAEDGKDRGQVCSQSAQKIVLSCDSNLQRYTAPYKQFDPCKVASEAVPSVEKALPSASVNHHLQDLEHSVLHCNIKQKNNLDIRNFARAFLFVLCNPFNRL